MPARISATTSLLRLRAWRATVVETHARRAGLHVATADDQHRVDAQLFRVGNRIIELLHEAKAWPAGAERDQFLAEACGEDAALKDQIVSLLEVEADDGGSFLKITPIIRQPILPTEKPGDRIGRYKLLEQIGEGGCGVVYMAEQVEPVHRRVVASLIPLQDERD